MTNQEAKFILEAYRANGNDADQALFSEALRQARNDPALMAWFERARAHDAAIAGKLRQVAPPPGLREAILAGAKASATRRSPWMKSLPWLAMAAGIMMVAAVGVAMWPTKASA